MLKLAGPLYAVLGCGGHDEEGREVHGRAARVVDDEGVFVSWGRCSRLRGPP